MTPDDDFTTAMRAESEARFEFTSDMIAFEDGAEWARAHLDPTTPDDPARDAGPRIVSLIRRVDAAEAEREGLHRAWLMLSSDTASEQDRANRAEAARDTAERQVKAVRSIVDEHRAGRRGTTSQLSFEGEALLLTSLSRALDGEACR